MYFGLKSRINGERSIAQLHLSAPFSNQLHFELAPLKSQNGAAAPVE